MTTIEERIAALPAWRRENVMRRFLEILELEKAKSQLRDNQQIGKASND